MNLWLLDLYTVESTANCEHVKIRFLLFYCMYCCTLFIVSVTIYCILFEYCGQVRKLAASRDIACVDCDGKGGSNVKQCQVNVENERERKRERELFRIYTLLQIRFLRRINESLLTLFFIIILDMQGVILKKYLKQFTKK